MFHTLKFAKILEEVGFSREQAETSIKILVEIMEDKLASKQDMLDLRMATQQDMREHRAATQHDIQELRTEMDLRFHQLESKLSLSESRLTVKIGTMLAASIAVLTAIQKLI